MEQEQKAKEEQKENEKEEQKETEEEINKRKKEEEEHQKYLEEEDNKEKKNLEKYRINYLSFKTSQPNTHLTAVCPICSDVPNISLSLNSETNHYVKCKRCRYCYCCSHPRSKTLDDYISIMVKLHQDNLKCEIHKEKNIEEEAYFSCEVCQKWMCEECINKHLEEEERHYYYVIRKVIKDKNISTCYKHNKEFKYYISDGFTFGHHACELCQIRFDSDEDLFTINKQEGECYYNQLKQIIKEGVDYLDIYCKNIYENFYNSIKDEPDLAKKAKDIYDKFLIRNRRLLFYFQMVINTGTPSFMNYNLIKNMGNCMVTKFDKINIKLSGKLNKEQIEQILNFFEFNYILGTKVYKLEEIKNIIDIKELSIIKNENEKKEDIIQNKNEEKKEKEDKKDNNDEKKEEQENEEENEKKYEYIDVIVLDKNIIIGGASNGELHIFEIDNSSMESKCIINQKAHIKSLISLDNIKDNNSRFVTCDEKEIKIWLLKKKENNDYILNCQTTFKEISESALQYLYVLNCSNSIAFINEDSKVIILNTYYKPFFKVNFDIDLKGLYQIDSNDENNGVLVVGGRDTLIFYQLLGAIKYLGCCKSFLFSGKSMLYAGNNKLLAGGVDSIHIINVKDIKLEYIIEMNSSEFSCFLRFKDVILCGYGDTSGNSYWSGGIAQYKSTKFLVLKFNENKIEKYFLDDEFNEMGITVAKFIEKDKFVSCFYHDKRLKIFQLK